MKQFANVRAHKPENIENRNGYIVGGSMDAIKNNQGYVCRGERELEPYMVMYPGYNKSVATKKQVLNPEYPKTTKKYSKKD